jgi:hypothetical protein
LKSNDEDVSQKEVVERIAIATMTDMRYWFTATTIIALCPQIPLQIAGFSKSIVSFLRHEKEMKILLS